MLGGAVEIGAGDGAPEEVLRGEEPLKRSIRFPLGDLGRNGAETSPKLSNLTRLAALKRSAAAVVEWNRGCKATPAYSSNCVLIWLLICVAKPKLFGKSKSFIKVSAN